MKFAVVVFACVIAATSAQFNRANAFASFGSPQQRYNPYQQQQNQYQRYQPQPTPAVTVYKPAVAAVPNPVNVVARVVADGRSANTLKYGNDVGPDGSFNYYFETDNSITAQAQGSPRNLGGNPEVIPVVHQGSFSWTSPEGKPIAISYVADENGYQPQGDSLPVPPAVPAQIQRALEYAAKYVVGQRN